MSLKTLGDIYGKIASMYKRNDKGRFIKGNTDRRKFFVGQKFGYLEILDFKDKYHAECICICGNKKIAQLSSLRRSKNPSCGCAVKHFIKHGDCQKGKRERLYTIWAGMRGRCKYKNTANWKNYGGKGITVAKEWENYMDFKDWAISSGYSDNLEIDRIDNNKNYCPENCRWVDSLEQSNNRGVVKKIKYKGMEKTLNEWAKFIGIKKSTLGQRYYTYKWTLDKCFREGVF